MPAHHVEQINALVELDRIGVEWESAGDDEVKLKCPVHDDQSPSVGLNTEKNLWRCRSCKAKGDIIGLLAHFLKVERLVIASDLKTRYDLAEIKAISPKQVEKWHSCIWKEAGPLMLELTRRGISENMIRKARLGFAKGRITIPVYDTSRNIINVRRYLPGAPGPEKMRNLPGFGGLQLYQSEQLKYGTIWITGGELKALVVGDLLNKHGVGAISPTAGEGAWDVRWNASLKGKDVYICMDIDAAGHGAARKVGNLIFRDAENVYTIILPLDTNEYPKGDINDYVGYENAGDKELIQCQERAILFEPSVGLDDPVPEDITQTNLVDSIKPENVGRRIRFKATAIGQDEEPYLLPKRVRVQCDRNQPRCASCSIYTMDEDAALGSVDVTIKSTSKQLLNFIGLADKGVPEALKNLLGIPTCKIVKFNTLERSELTEILLQPEFEHGDVSREVNRVGYIIGPPPELNAVYFFTGVVWEHPRSQKATLLLHDTEEAGDNLSSFVKSPQDLESLNYFKPKRWTTQSLQKKINSIYDDLASNVTQIYYRQSLHMAIDLTYHSPLSFRLGNKEINGWMNTLIIGDTAQGKSETVDRMLEFYRLGGRADCKNATVPGLLGGVQQVGTRWFVSWGVIPRFDRRLAVLEEVKGASVEVLSKLTDMRSRGIATIDKIIQRKISARTRLIFLSNPRSDRSMEQYAYGVEAIPELVGSPEDVRRFDLALCVDKREIKGKDLKPKTMESELDSDVCRRLILWSWTRTSDQVVFEDEDDLMNKSEELKEKFTGALPLIDEATTVAKIARLSAALAARTFSTPKDDLETLLVRKCHVETISQWLTKVYSSPASGYLDFTKRYRAANQMRDPEEVTSAILRTRYPKDFVSGLLITDQISDEDIASWTSQAPEEVRSIMSIFVRKNAISRIPRQRRSFTKTAGFIDLLKKLEPTITKTPASNSNDRF
tara:strand:- start:33376 stop:36225 length:2850 start_codon:yes stop_codon:yes gene_type:complete